MLAMEQALYFGGRDHDRFTEEDENGTEITHTTVSRDFLDPMLRQIITEHVSSYRRKDA